MQMENATKKGGQKTFAWEPLHYHRLAWDMCFAHSLDERKDESLVWETCNRRDRKSSEVGEHPDLLYRYQVLYQYLMIRYGMPHTVQYTPPTWTQVCEILVSCPIDGTIKNWPIWIGTTWNWEEPANSAPLLQRVKPQYCAGTLPIWYDMPELGSEPQ